MRIRGRRLLRTVRETLDVASATATSTFPILRLIHAKTAATGAPANKAPQINGATPSAGQAAPAADGLTVVFHAETTGTGTCDTIYATAGGTAVPNADGTSIVLGAETAGAGAVAELVYVTTDPPLDDEDEAASGLDDNLTGF